MINSSSSRHKSTKRIINRPSLPSPATFSRTSSSEIIQLNQHQSDSCNSSIDQSIRGEVFGGEGAQSRRDKHDRVRARQLAAEEKSMTRSLKSKERRHWVGGGGSCNSSVYSASTERSSVTLQRSESTKTQVLNDLHDSLEGQEEEKPWYLQTPQEMLKSEQLKAKRGNDFNLTNYFGCNAKSIDRK